MSKFDTKKNKVVAQSPQRNDGAKTSKRTPQFNKVGIRILSRRDSAYSGDRHSDD